MSDVKLEKESKIESVELSDCGKASRVTRGLPIILWFELGTPPWNKMIPF